MTTITNIGQELATIIDRWCTRDAKQYGLTLAGILDRMPTLSSGQACDLKIDRVPDDRGVRVYLSRCGLADGEPFERTVYLDECDPDTDQWAEVGYFDGDMLLSDLLPPVTPDPHAQAHAEISRLGEWPRGTAEWAKAMRKHMSDFHGWDPMRLSIEWDAGDLDVCHQRAHNRGY
jgi:hypothetical protein